jgi:hypothetical protein
VPLIQKSTRLKIEDKRPFTKKAEGGSIAKKTKNRFSGRAKANVGGLRRGAGKKGGGTHAY